MEHKHILRFSFIVVILLFGVFLLLVPIFYYNFNHETASFYIGYLSLIVFSISVIVIILMLLGLILDKLTDLSQGERIIVVCFVGGNLIFIFIFIGLSFNSTIPIDQSLYVLIAILCVMFNGVSSIIVAAMRSRKIKKNI